MWHGAEPMLSSSRVSSQSRLVVTGHLTEWMTYLPLELQPPADVYKAAVHWLLPQLELLSQSPTYNDRAWFCPWTHAMCALKTLCGGGT